MRGAGGKNGRRERERERKKKCQQIDSETYKNTMVSEQFRCFSSVVDVSALFSILDEHTIFKCTEFRSFSVKLESWAEPSQYHRNIAICRKMYSTHPPSITSYLHPNYISVLKFFSLLNFHCAFFSLSRCCFAFECSLVRLIFLFVFNHTTIIVLFFISEKQIKQMDLALWKCARLLRSNYEKFFSIK